MLQSLDILSSKPIFLQLTATLASGKNMENDTGTSMSYVRFFANIGAYMSASFYRGRAIQVAITGNKVR